MEMAGQGHNYRQLAEEIGEVLQAAAETAEKMQDDARVEAARIQGEAEAELRVACAEGRRILDDARMEADMVRAEAEWQSKEIIAQARHHAAERLAGAHARLADLEKAETRVMDRLAGVGQVLSDSMASLREGPAIADIATSASTMTDPETSPEHDDRPDAKVYFVEFPPVAPVGASAADDDQADDEIVLSESAGASLFADDAERSEWAPPTDLPTWWTRGGVQG